MTIDNADKPHEDDGEGLAPGADMQIIGEKKLERFFRKAAALDVDKADIKRYNDFMNHKIYDMLLIAQSEAKANGRDIIQPWDLPITKGLQESMHAFEELNEELAVEPILEQLATLPQLDRAPSAETEARLPIIAGGLSVALARTFKIIDPNLKNPQTEEWERAYKIFDQLL